MCGILTHFKNTPLTHSDLTLALNSLAYIDHRGPDSDGLMLINTDNGKFTAVRTAKTPADISAVPLNEVNPADYNLIFGHKRLSIFDLSSNGFQPMRCPKTGNIIVFNGEIYNFYEIRLELQEKGHSFATGSDTEVILAAYAQWGHKCLARFNGMWSFIIFDNTRKQLFVTNDRFGVKPLYYSSSDTEIVFASELKQFLAYPHLKGDYNKPLIKYFITENLIDFNNQTFFANVFRFLKSTYAVLDKPSKKFTVNSYYKLEIKKTSYSFKDAQERFKELLNDAVKIRLRADVPVGIAVSGGLDSSSIFVLAHKQLKEQGKEKNLRTFSATFPNNKVDESTHIHNLLKHYDCIKHEVNPLDYFSVEDLRRHLFQHDYPSTTASFYSDYCLSRLTSQHNVKVLLNGQGADEIFAGYHHHFYKYAASLLRNLKFAYYNEQVNAYSSVKGISLEKIKRAVYSDVKLILKQKLGIKIKDNFSAKSDWLYAKNLDELMLVDMLQTAIPNFLTSNDRNTMSFGVESRHPFMDFRLVEFGFSLPDEYRINNGFQKLIMREAMNELPEEIRWRKDKMGFVTPDDEFIKLLAANNTINKDILRKVDLDFKEEYKYYSLAIWMNEYI